MISVADLLVTGRIPGHYYANQFYIKGDLEMGLLENRRGDRLLALPSTLIEAIFSGLQKETGGASSLVLFNCGRWWGKNFYNRFCDELSHYYGSALVDMKMAEFVQCLQNCWATYGWGQIEFDPAYQHQGFLVLKTRNSHFAAQSPTGTLPACSLDAGVFSAFFSQLTGRDLHCIQTSCESLGADCNYFVVGLKKRIEPAEAMLEKQTDHESIMRRLCA